MTPDEAREAMVKPWRERREIERAARAEFDERRAYGLAERHRRKSVCGARDCDSQSTVLYPCGFRCGDHAPTNRIEKST